MIDPDVCRPTVGTIIHAWRGCSLPKCGHDEIHEALQPRARPSIRQVDQMHRSRFGQVVAQQRLQAPCCDLPANSAVGCNTNPAPATARAARTRRCRSAAPPNPPVHRWPTASHGHHARQDGSGNHAPAGPRAWRAAPAQTPRTGSSHTAAAAPPPPVMATARPGSTSKPSSIRSTRRLLRSSSMFNCGARSRPAAAAPARSLPQVVGALTRSRPRGCTCRPATSASACCTCSSTAGSRPDRRCRLRSGAGGGCSVAARHPDAPPAAGCTCPPSPPRPAAVRRRRSCHARPRQRRPACIEGIHY